MATHSSYSCLGNPMDRGAWRATLHRGCKGVTHNWTTSPVMDYFVVSKNADENSEMGNCTCFSLSCKRRCKYWLYWSYKNMQHLLSVYSVPETLPSSFLLTPPNNPKRWVLLLLHFTNEEAEDPSGDFQCHTARKWQIWDSNPGPWAPKSRKGVGRTQCSRK